MLQIIPWGVQSSERRRISRISRSIGLWVRVGIDLGQDQTGIRGDPAHTGVDY